MTEANAMQQELDKVRKQISDVENERDKAKMATEHAQRDLKQAVRGVVDVNIALLFLFQTNELQSVHEQKKSDLERANVLITELRGTAQERSERVKEMLVEIDKVCREEMHPQAFKYHYSSNRSCR